MPRRKTIFVDRTALLKAIAQITDQTLAELKAEATASCAGTTAAALTAIGKPIAT